MSKEEEPVDSGSKFVPVEKSLLHTSEDKRQIAMERGESYTEAIRDDLEARESIPCGLKMEAEYAEAKAQVLDLYRALSRVADEMDRPLERVGRFTASDVNVVPSDVPALDGLGPVGHRTRTFDEYMEGPTVAERAVLVALYLRDLSLAKTGAAGK